MEGSVSMHHLVSLVSALKDMLVTFVTKVSDDLLKDTHLIAGVC